MVRPLAQIGHDLPIISAPDRRPEGLEHSETCQSIYSSFSAKAGVGKDKGERSREDFHSFRATLSGKLFCMGVDGDLSRRLTGRAAKDVHEGVYLGAVAIPMARAAEVISRDSFGLEHSRIADTEAYKKARNRKPTVRNLVGA